MMAPLAHLHADRQQGHRRAEDRRARHPQHRPRHHRRPRAAARIAAASTGTAATTDSAARGRRQRHHHRRHRHPDRRSHPGRRDPRHPVRRRALRRTETGSADGQPAAITAAWYPLAIAAAAPRLAESQALPAGALAYITEAAGDRPARALEEHAAAAADDDTAAALGITPGTPVLITRTRHHTADGKLIQYAETITPAGHWHTRAYTITGN